PLLELKRAVRDLAKDDAATPVVAGPWQGDEIGELLYWIPFLRWAVSTTLGLRERLVVVAPAGSAHRYASVADRVVASGAGEAGARLDPALVESLRGELAAEALRGTRKSML